MYRSQLKFTRRTRAQDARRARILVGGGIGRNKTFNVVKRVYTVYNLLHANRERSSKLATFLLDRALKN